MKQRFPLLVLVAFLLVAPRLLPEFYVTLLNYIGLYALVALGLVLLTGIAGLTSFGQAAFVGLGAYASAYATTAHGLSPWLGLVVALLLTLVVALALGLVTMRLSGHYLPLGTIAWGISLYFLFGNLETLGGHTGISGVPPLELAGFSLQQARDYSYLIWAIVLLAVWGLGNLLDSRAGRAIRALKGGLVMAEAMGVNTTRVRIVVFIIAALLACISGWLYAHLQRFVNPTPFALTQGIEYLFMAVVGGIGHLWGALLGAALVTVTKQWLQDYLPALLGTSGNFEIVVFGLIMILLLQKARDGLWPKLAARARSRPPLRVDARSQPLPRRPLPAPGSEVLRVDKATKRFGGLVANHEMSFAVAAGEIVALIGPNGAGKSTLFNGISGVDPLSSGAVLFAGQAVQDKGARRIAGLGLSRSFQHVRLLPEMSVLENVAIGAHLRGSKGVLAAVLRLDRGEEARLLELAATQIARVGLGGSELEAAGSLALGKQRIVEIARALAADPSLLLLDEPAAGLRYLEKQALAELLRQLRAAGMSILLVEHDMDFVMGLADRIVVMEFGEKIAEGDPPAIQRDRRVREAYLGEGA